MLARLASLVLFTCLLLQGGHCQSGDPCPSVIGEPSCVCNHPDGMGIIDARSLALQESEGPPKYVAYNKPHNWVFILSTSGLKIYWITLSTSTPSIRAIRTHKACVTMFM